MGQEERDNWVMFLSLMFGEYNDPDKHLKIDAIIEKMERQEEKTPTPARTPRTPRGLPPYIGKRWRD